MAFIHSLAPVPPSRRPADKNVHRKRVRAAAFSGCLWLTATSLCAQTEPGRVADQDAASQPPSAPFMGWLEETRRHTYQGSHWLVRSIDGWFGDEPFEQRGKVSGYVRVNTLWDEFYGSNANVRFRLRAALPNLEGRAYAFIGQDNEREVITDQPEQFTREQMLNHESRRDDQSFFAGLGYAAMEKVDFRLGFRGGLNVYAQARFRHQWALSPRDTLFFRESIFWSSKDSFGSTTVLDYEHALSPTLAARWSTSGTITRRSDGFEWHSGLGLFKEFPGMRSAATEAIVYGSSDSGDASNYGLRASWRQPVYRDWLFGKVTLGHFWPKDRKASSREEAWAAGLTLDMYF